MLWAKLATFWIFECIFEFLECLESFSAWLFSEFVWRLKTFLNKLFRGLGPLLQLQPILQLIHRLLIINYIPAGRARTCLRCGNHFLGYCGGIGDELLINNNTQSLILSATRIEFFIPARGRSTRWWCSGRRIHHIILIVNFFVFIFLFC